MEVLVNVLIKRTGAPTNPNGVVSENDNFKLFQKFQKWLLQQWFGVEIYLLFLKKEKFNVNFMEPVIPEIPSNVS